MSKPLDSGKTFFGISVNTDQMCMGFETDTRENESNMSIDNDPWLKSYWRATE